MLVVMPHSVNVYQLDGLYWVQYLWIFIMTFTMPLFMMISGFWFKPRALDYSLKHYLYPFLLFSVLNISLGAICGAISQWRGLDKRWLGNVVYMVVVHL